MNALDCLFTPYTTLVLRLEAICIALFDLLEERGSGRKPGRFDERGSGRIRPIFAGA